MALPWRPPYKSATEVPNRRGKSVIKALLQLSLRGPPSAHLSLYPPAPDTPISNHDNQNCPTLCCLRFLPPGLHAIANRPGIRRVRSAADVSKCRRRRDDPGIGPGHARPHRRRAAAEGLRGSRQRAAASDSFAAGREVGVESRDPGG